MSTPQAVVFDFGGVIFDWDPLHVYNTLIPDDKERAYFLREICNNEWNIQQDAGRSLAEATAERIAKFPHYTTLITAYYQRWPDMLKGELPRGIHLLQRLHQANIPLFGLTNWSAETFPYAEANFPVLQLFRDIVVSGREQLIKPDPRIFALLEQRSGFAGNELFFIDDNASNINAAQQCGWHAVHHHDTAIERTVQALEATGFRF